MDAKEALKQIFETFEPNVLIDFFRAIGVRTLTPFISSYKIEVDTSLFCTPDLLGVIKLGNEDELAVFTVKVIRSLTERSGKKAQYELAKKILKTENRYIAGIFIFHDDKNDFRFSLVYSVPLATGKRDWSNFRRYTYFVSKEQSNKTFLKQIGEGDFSTLEKIKEAFSVEKVTNEFFDAYRYALNEKIIKALNNNVEYRIRHSFAQQVLSRILFIYFLQRKGWLKWKDYKQDKNYIKNLWFIYKSKSKTKGTFYSQWLSSLFFGAFNKKTHLINSELPDEIKESFSLMPFLNGGLFAKNELDELNFDLPDNIFEWLFEPDEQGNNKQKGFLEIFNFTIDEASLDDVEVAVDPEMLGKVYESLINEEERGDAGIFYTPRVEIDFMCRFSLVNYLASKTQISKQDLFDIIFNPDSIKDYQNTENLISIRKYLLNSKIVDPAVGSASFLVGMMNILVELHSALKKRIEAKEENLFALKHRIILENLYGVDVKDWAVMVGELRLWLSLIIETDEKYMDIYTKPLLPNLSFKIRQGDSLVEEVGGVFINLRGDALKNIPNSVKQKISDLIDKKAEFFSGKRSADLKEQLEIENLEIEIFKEILQTKIDDLSKMLSSKTQSLKQLANSKNLFGEKDQSSKKELKKLSEDIEQIQNELTKYHNALAAIGKNGKKDYFLWELDFAEVFALNCGFDIVIGNPPYVRQELVAPPLENEKNYSADDWRKLKSHYKDKLIQSTQNVWQDIKKIDKKSDLYIFFYFQGLSLLNDNGIFCFINSNSWLDVGYGTGLQEFLLKKMQPLYIIDNIAKRSFKQADVNTVIVFIQKPKEKPDDFTLKFIAFKKPFEEVITPEVLKEIENTTLPVFDHPIYRVYPKTKKELLEEGVEYPDETELDLNQNPEQLPYIGNKWGGKYLRAPEIYFKILEKGRGRLVELGEIANLQRGLVTGLDTYVFLSEEKVKDFKLERSFLKKVVISPRQCKTCVVRSSDIDTFAIYTEKTKKELKGTNLLKYIEGCEKEGALKRATAKDSHSWYIYRKQQVKLPCIAIPRAPYLRFPIFLIIDNILINDMVIIEPINGSDVELICVLLISTFGIFLLEMTSRHNLGLGTLKFEKLDAIHYPILDLKFFSSSKKEQLINQLKVISKREILSIFKELGINPQQPLREQEPNPLPDRKELDDIVFDALGLTQEERKEVYWAVAELVKARLDKAKSV